MPKRATKTTSEALPISAPLPGAGTAKSVSDPSTSGVDAKTGINEKIADGIDQVTETESQSTQSGEEPVVGEATQNEPMVEPLKYEADDVDNNEAATTDSQASSEAVPTQPPDPVSEPILDAIRQEFQKAIDLRPVDPREFDFKVTTVKWFGILCAVALLLILAANAYFIDQLFETGRSHKSSIEFQTTFNQTSAVPRIYEIAVENEALNMRNNRTVSALFMRAYTQFLALTAGTILAMFGAIFVLARVDSRETRAEATWKDFRWLVNTASP
jgi:hypothetical protein